MSFLVSFITTATHCFKLPYFANKFDFMKTYRSSRLQEVPEIEGVTDKFKYEIGSKYSTMAQKLIHLDLVKIDFLNTFGIV